MEPPAVTSCSGLNSQSSVRFEISKSKMFYWPPFSTDKNRRDNMGVEFLHIDPGITFNASSNRHFEDLPENFLETISPQQQPSSMSMGMSSQQDGNQLGIVTSPQLVSLAPMSVASSNDHR